MRSSNIPDDHPLEASITDGYDIIGADGDTQFDSYEQTASELGDDVQSLADTDTGTDAYTNDVDTDSSSDDEDDDMMDMGVDQADDAVNDSAAETDEEDGDDEDDDEADMSMAEQSLEHPTELFTPDSAHISRRASFSELDNAGPGQDRGTITDSSKTASKERTTAGDDTRSPNKKTSWTVSSPGDLVRMLIGHLQNDHTLRQRLMYFVVFVHLLFAGMTIKDYMQGNGPAYTSTLTTVPVASVSYISTQHTPEVLATTAVATSTVAYTKTPSHALQTTSAHKSVASIPTESELQAQPSICSAQVYGRNEILLRVPLELKSSWLAKRALMISVSRGTHDISSEATKITPVEQGFIIEVPHEEAHGVLDVSIATTRKPKIKETFPINFASFMIVDALDAGKQLLKDFAHSVADTLNGTSAWVEETCSPAFDMMPKSAALTNSFMQGLQDVTDAALSLPGQVAGLARSPYLESRVQLAGKELWRTAQDLQDDTALLILQAQLTSKLQWLRWTGQDAKYEQYLSAAGPFYQKKQEELALASRARTEVAKKEIRARRRQEDQESRTSMRSFWRTSEGAT